MGKLTTSLLLSVAALAASGPVASAQAPAAGGSAAPGTGGAPAMAAATPAITGISCHTGCSGLERATAGSAVRIAGSSLGAARQVVFLGGRGPRDNVTVPVQDAGDDGVDVVVPAGARSGRLRVIAAGGVLSRASSQQLTLGGGSAAGAPLLQAHVDSKRVLLDGRTRPSVSFFLGGSQPGAVRVDLLRDGEASPIASWTPDPAPAGTVQTIAWDGAVGPVPPPEGRYVFRITPLGGGSAAPRAAQAGGPASGGTVATGFLLVSHVFPVRGPHQIGLDPSQRFGAQRNGHTHQGQDVFAACGTPLVAVHSGVVRYKAFQAAAGNYVVLREDGDGTDFAYMHLRDPALVARGQRVATGQLIGYVGDTGDAEGCHLHFEKWPAPGWYSGGAPVDPLADLQSWPAP